MTHPTPEAVARLIDPCPFCGAEGHVVTHSPNDSIAPDAWTVGCYTPYCPGLAGEVPGGLMNWPHSEEAAILRWNKRAMFQAPEGWRRVPITPSREMKAAGEDAQHESPNLDPGVTACVGRARAIAAWAAMIAASPSPPPGHAPVQGWRDVEGAPKFGDAVENGWASEANPTRVGLFVREGFRTGKMNRGRYFEVTDGNGKFWELPLDRDHKITVRRRCP